MEFTGAYRTRPTFISAVYYPNWRAEPGTLPSDIHLDGCSHVTYAFATVQASGTVYLTDEQTDCLMPFEEVRGCLAEWQRIKKARGVKVLISIGGGTGASGKNFPIVASDPRARKPFAVTARALVDRYDLDGVDIDWDPSPTEDQGGDYVQLLAALNACLPASCLLTSALPAGEWALKNIDLAEACRYLDFVNLKAYDFYGPWTEVAGHHAALSPPRVVDPSPYPSGIAAVKYATAHGMPSRKILLGIPTYGRSFLGANKADDPYTALGGKDGTIDFRDLPQDGTVEAFDKDVVGAYCVGGDGGWVSYDDRRSVAIKAKYVKDHDLGGLFYWHACSDGAGKRNLFSVGQMALTYNYMPRK